MQEQIEKIEIILENCEMIIIEGKYIGDLSIEDIKYSIHRDACNSISEWLTCKELSMSINRNANLDTEEIWTLGLTDNKRDQFARINNHSDITSIYIYFADNKVKHIYVPWNEDSDYFNKYQKSHINNYGDLFILISKESELNDVFNLEEIEDKNNIDFIWSMYE